MKRYLLFLLIMISSATLYFVSEPMIRDAWSEFNASAKPAPLNYGPSGPLNMTPQDLATRQVVSVVQGVGATGSWDNPPARWTDYTLPNGCTETIRWDAHGEKAWSSGLVCPPPAPKALPPRHMVMKWDPRDSLIFDDLGEMDAAVQSDKARNGLLYKAWSSGNCVINRPYDQTWTCYPHGGTMIEARMEPAAVTGYITDTPISGGGSVITQGFSSTQSVSTAQPLSMDTMGTLRVSVSGASSNETILLQPGGNYWREDLISGKKFCARNESTVAATVPFYPCTR